MNALLLKIWKLLQLPKSWQLAIVRLRESSFLVGVTGVFFNEKNDVLLFEHTYRPGWSLPGGYIKGKEHPKAGLEREVLEESGLVVSADTRMKIRTDRETARLDITYAGVYIGGSFIPSDEVKKAQFFSFDTLPDIRTDQLQAIHDALLVRKNKKPLIRPTIIKRFTSQFRHTPRSPRQDN
jgi:8-oxo-dGTP pyrophosphatase MutT (NUDIX family)